MDDVIVAFWMTVGISVVEAVLLLVIFRRAGFTWVIAGVALAPLVGLALQYSLIFFGRVTPSEGVSIALPLALLPLLVLTFKSWPMAALPDTSPETSK
jgi:hypothetical protein